MRLIRKHLSYANVMSTFGVFIALGIGSAYAADKIGSKDIAKNAVKSKHIKNEDVRAQDLGKGAVKSNKLARDAVNTRKVADGSLLGVDFAPGERPQDGADGSPDTPSQVLSKLTEVDGSGSRLDADLLDGRDSVQFARFAGRLREDGTTAQGEGFTSRRDSEGAYSIDFPAGTFLNPATGQCRFPLAVATPFVEADRIATINSLSCNNGVGQVGEGTVSVQIRDGDGSKTDTPFFFIAY
jgi:hypothetical protein